MSKSVVKRVFVRVGAASVLRTHKRRRLRILMYHRFHGDRASVETVLRPQLQHLRDYYHPVSLGQAAECLRAGRALPEGAIAVTIDDGYGDFENAWPIFRAFDVPATLFVVSEFADRKLWLWPDVVQYALRNCAAPRLTITLPDGTNLDLSLSSPPERLRAQNGLVDWLTAAPDALRRDAVRSLPDQCGVELPSAIPEEYAPLGWDDLRRLAGEGLAIGAHTRTHPILSRLPSRSSIQQEISGSKRAIEMALGRPVEHFCYPNGTADDFNQDCLEAVSDGGFSCAVTALRGTNARDADLFSLRRIGVDPSRDSATFALEVAGFRMQ